MNRLTDLEIISRINAGETMLYSQLVDRYKHMVYTAAIRMVRVREDAEEIAQDTFLSVFKTLATFRGDCLFSTWLYRVAYNKCLDHLKKNKRKVSVQDIDISETFNIGYLDKKMYQLEQQERLKMIKEAIDSLPDDMALLVTLFYLEENSLKEISAITGQSVNTLKVKLFRSRKRLLSHLSAKLEPEIIERYES